MDPGPGSLLAKSGAAEVPCCQQLVLPLEKERHALGCASFFTWKKLCFSDPGFEGESELFDQTL